MRALAKMVAPISRRVRLIVARAVVTLIDDATKLQAAQVQLLAGETRDGVERFQQYGFTSTPHAGAEGIVVCVAGRRDHAVLIAVDDRRYRLKNLAAGEVALYTDEGDSIVLKRSNTIEITTQTLTVKASTKVRMETPQLEVTGDIKDQCDGTGRTMNGMRETYDTHTHPGDSGGTTGEPNQSM